METEDRINGRFKPGWKGGPGVPAGYKSIKQKIRQYLDDHPEEEEAIIKYFVKYNRELMWQMLEGRPQQDVTSGGDKLIPNPIFGGLSKSDVSELSKDDSDQQNLLPQEENPSS